MRFLSIFSAVLAVIVLVAGVFLYFTDSNKDSLARHTPEEIEKSPIVAAYVDSNIEMHEAFPTDASIVFIGDSRVHQPHWDDLFPHASVANRGISGDTFHGLLKRIHNLGIEKPDVLLLELGVNDVMLGYELDAIRNNADAAIAQLKQQAVRLVVLEVMDCRAEGCEREKVATVNSYLKSISDKSGVQFVELNSRLAGPEGLRQDLSQDGVHLNAEGYKQLVGILCAQVRELACAGKTGGQNAAPAQ